jgi:hypothetical protein
MGASLAPVLTEGTSSSISSLLSSAWLARSPPTLVGWLTDFMVGWLGWDLRVAIVKGLVVLLTPEPCEEMRGACGGT